ncbi:MAG: tetratricopeptide repeat protein [Thermoplasmata archaeon]
MSPPLFGGDPEKKLLDEIRDIVETAKKYQRAGKTMEAATEFRAALRTYNKYVEEVKKLRNEYSNILTEIGRGLYALDEVERAIEALEKALQLNPKNVSAWLFKGSIHFANPGTANYAVICYTEAVKLDPRNITAWRNLGDAYRALGKNEEAISAYRNLIKVEPNNLANYDRILKINPNDTMALEGKASIFMKQGKIEEAVEIYKLLFELDSNIKYYDAIVALKPEAAESLKKMLAPQPEVKPVSQTAQQGVEPQLEIQPEKHEAIEQHAEGIIEKTQQEIEEELELLPVREEKTDIGKTEELPTLSKITLPPPETPPEIKPIELKSVKIERMEEPGVPATKVSEPAEISQIINMEFTRDKPETSMVKQYVSENVDDKEKLMVILDKLLEVERFKDLVEVLEAILPVHTTDDVFWYYNGLALAKLGKLKEALDSFSVSAKLNPDDPDTYLAIGTIYSQLRDYEKATEALNEVLKRRPKEGEAWYLKSVLEAVNGDYNKAKAFLKQAVVLDKEYRERAKTESAFEGMKDDPGFKSIVE